MPWNPDLYHQFERERSAPFADLLALVHPCPGMRVVDLGCGTGELTRRLADSLPESDVLGIDKSPDMLARAAAYTRPGLRFSEGDIRTVGGPWHLIISHAALQWVEDHATLIPRLLSLLSPGGQLVVQVPSNHDHVSHTLIQELAGQEPFRSALGGWHRVSPVLSIEEYARLLFTHEASEITVFEKVYPHVLSDAGALADWTSGTALVPYFERLSLELRVHYMALYRARLAIAFPTSPVFYPFKRILFAATAPAPHGDSAGAGLEA